MASLGTPQLGLKPLNLSDPYKADSEFDSTVRIPIRPARSLAAPAPALGTAPIGQTTVNYPTTRGLPPTPPPPTPPATPTPTPTTPTTPSYLGPSLPQTYDPSQLNFEGTSGQQFLSGIPATNSVTATPSDATVSAVSSHIQKLQDFSGLPLPTDWRTQLYQDPQKFLDTVKGIVLGGNLNNVDSKMRQRLEDWYANLEKIVGSTTAQQANPDYKVGYLGQQAFNQAIQQLKLTDASSARSDEEQLMALLQSRGLLGTGAAAEALTQFREQRMQNFYDAATAFSQALLSGQISQVNARDLTTLQADLAKRNAESLAALQNKYALEQIKAGRPDPLAQLFGTGIGVLGASLLAPKAPGTNGGAAAPSTTPYTPSTYRLPEFQP